MKISFSTLACPDFSWTDIYTMAKDLGFGGIEIRGLGEDIFAVNARPFTDERLPKTLEKLQSLGLEIPCLAAGCALKYKEDFDKNISEIVQYIVLAKKLGTPYIRVLGDRYPQPEGEVDDAFVVDALKLLGVIAQGFNVCLLVETNGVYSDTKRLRELLDKVNMPSVAALWDMHHPYRYAGESPRETVQNLGGLIKYVHVKDSVMVDGRPQYRMMGEGDLPIPQMLDALVDIGDATFPDVLDRMVKEFPDQICFKYTELDYTRTYSEFRNDVDQFARALIAMGVKKGDHVAIWATNVPQWYITFWAATKIGAVLVTVNTAYKIHEAEYLLRQSDTHTLVMIDGYKASSTPSACLCCAMSSPWTASRRAATPGSTPWAWAIPCPPPRWRTAAARCARTTCATCSTPPAPQASPRASCSPTTTW